MIRHTIKLIWNQRGKHLGLSIEILFSFWVLFAVCSFALHHGARYFHPLGFEYQDVWQVQTNWQNIPEENRPEIAQLINHQLEGFPEIISYSFTAGGNTPFSMGNISGQIRDPYTQNETDYNIFSVDDRFDETMQIKLLEGAWFEPEDRALKGQYRPIVVTEDLSHQIWGKNSAIGKKLETDGELYTVKGIVPAYRKSGDLEAIVPGAFFLTKPEHAESVLLHLSPQTGAAFEAKLMRTLQSIAPAMSFKVSYLDKMRIEVMYFRLIPLLIMTIVTLFLIGNVALGLFGVLWQNISKRREEIGIRRAIGSTRGEITRQFIAEMIVLASLSMVLGIFFAIQFPLLGVLGVKSSIYLIAIVLASMCIYVLVALCAVLPSKQAASLHPAVALRAE